MEMVIRLQIQRIERSQIAEGNLIKDKEEVNKDLRAVKDKVDNLSRHREERLKLDNLGANKDRE